MKLTKKQVEVLAALQANLGQNRYHRYVGVMQPNEFVTAGDERLDRAAGTVRALEAKGLVRIDARNYQDPAYPIHVTVKGREALEGCYG